MLGSIQPPPRPPHGAAECAIFVRRMCAIYSRRLDDPHAGHGESDEFRVSDNPSSRPTQSAFRGSLRRLLPSVAATFGASLARGRDSNQAVSSRSLHPTRPGPSRYGPWEFAPSHPVSDRPPGNVDLGLKRPGIRRPFRSLAVSSLMSISRSMAAIVDLGRAGKKLYLQNFDPTTEVGWNRVSCVKSCVYLGLGASFGRATLVCSYCCCLLMSRSSALLSFRLALFWK